MESVLTAIAESIQCADRVAGVQVVVAEPPRRPVRAMGAAGFAPDPALLGRLQECRARGARLASFDAPEPASQRVLTGRRERMLADGAWLPVHDYIREVEWSDYIATPIPLGREHGGVINCYIAADAAVTEPLLRFLRAMAQVAAAALATAASSPAAPRDADRAWRLDRLTARERDAFALLGEGLSNRDIGARLGIAERTAATHVSNLLVKLDLPSRTRAALWASSMR
ncbi:MAG: helix-turn-helix transcriptional regulator [Microbacterium sp.]|uniref:helix-turn-helix transcriptional regulator n=1 Tax=Microbacterium sp. TaxID=51671 RepID=UPI0039E5811C